MLRLLLAAAVVLAPAIAAAQGESDLFGVVEISASGVKGLVLQITKEQALAIEPAFSSGRVQLKYNAIADRQKREYAQTIPSNTARPEQIEATRKAVRMLIDSMKQEHTVPAKDIFVVASSSVAALPHYGALKEVVEAEIGGRIDRVTPAEECALSYRWITPRNRYSEVVLIDFGSGNVKACYVHNPGTARQVVHGFELLSVGTKTFRDVVSARVGPNPLNLEGFAREVQKAARKEVVPAVERVKRNNPGLENLPQLYLLGGIVWATSALVRPRDFGKPWIAMSAADAVTLQNRVVRGRAFTVNVPQDMPKHQREALDKAINTIRSHSYTQEELLAGTELLITLGKQLRWELKEKILFSNAGRDAWRAQYLIDKITGGEGHP